MAKKSATMAKKTADKRDFDPTPEEIVAAWHEKLVESLDPWFLEPAAFKKLEPKLRRRITELKKNGRKFTEEDMQNSLQVAGDSAEICKILQPDPFPKKVDTDTFQPVLQLCARFHKVCQGGGGGGGWCDI